MRISVISVVERNGLVVAWVRAVAPKAGAKIMIGLQFEPERRSAGAGWWEEAYDRALAVLDVA